MNCIPQIMQQKFKLSKFILSAVVWVMIMGLISARTVQAQGETKQRFTEGQEVAITVEEAIQIALVNNHMLRNGRLDLDIAETQIREAWGSVYPQVSGSGRYTRNLKTPNPFAGSDAGGLFETFGAIEWLAFNEGARTDGNPNTGPISFDEFLKRQSRGYRDAGIAPPGSNGDNPFVVENQFNFGLNISQTIYNGAAFAAIRGAQQLRDVNEDGYQRQRQVVANNIRSAFYNTLLAVESAEVLRMSVERLRKTAEEAARSVEAGVASKFSRVSAEVELVNLETDLIEAENRADLAVRNLALQLGISPRVELSLRGSLDAEEMSPEVILEPSDAYEIALQQRSDLEQTRGSIELQKIEREINQSQYFPRVNAFANAAYIGSVPSNRTSVSPVEGEDFAFTSTERDFFDNSYWQPSVAVGFSLSWSIFDGFQRRAQIQRNDIAIRQSEISMEFQKNAIYLEIEEVIDNLQAAMKRIQSQERNLEQAELNYEFSVKRLQEGAGTALEERQASSLLDQSKLNHLSAVHDYLVAQSQYKTAIGQPIIDGQ